MPAPADLADKVLARLATDAQSANDNRRFNWRGLAQHAATLLLVCGLSGLVGWHLAQSTFEQHRLSATSSLPTCAPCCRTAPCRLPPRKAIPLNPGSTVASSLLQPSSDLTAEGFPSDRGRLDFIDNRRIASLVSQTPPPRHQRLHVARRRTEPEGAGAVDAAGLQYGHLDRWRHHPSGPFPTSTPKSWGSCKASL